jgi:hypothetical protein
LKDLFQFAKEQNLVLLCLGKRAHISKTMDAEFTPGEIKWMVKYAMGHANYQGLMTGKTIVGIALLDRGVEPMSNGSMVSLKMVLFNYFKMENGFYVFAKLHQTKALGPVLVIIPACEEAKRLVHMMNKQVAAFLYYFLKDAALHERFLMALWHSFVKLAMQHWLQRSQTATGTRTRKPSPPHTRKIKITMPRTSSLKNCTRKPST